jgi:hypothetical protein
MLQRKASPAAETPAPEMKSVPKPVRLASDDMVAGEGPARLMQERLAVAMAPRSETWSPRRAMAFAVLFNLTAWTAIIMVARGLLS